MPQEKVRKIAEEIYENSLDMDWADYDDTREQDIEYLIDRINETVNL